MSKFFRTYFNQTATAYFNRVQRGNAYQQYFYQQRIEYLIGDCKGKQILDIGAGTGVAYDYLMKQQGVKSYDGLDISKKMLELSNIPSVNQHVSSFEAYQLDKPYDLFIANGLTTYLNSSQVGVMFERTYNHAAPNASFVVSFTNNQAFDLGLRRLVPSWVKSLFTNKSVSISNDIFAIRANELQSIVGKWKVDKVSYFGFSVFPFTKFTPKLSRYIAELLWRRPSFWCKYFQTELLVTLKKNG